MPAVLRAGRRLRRRRPRRPRRARRRRVDRQRPEGVDVARPHRRGWVCSSCGTDPDAVKHAGHHRVRRRHARTRRGGAPAAADDRRGRVQRGVLHRRARSRTPRSLGAPGDGWRVSLTTLMNERVSIGGAIAATGSGPIASGRRLWRALPDERRGAGGPRRADAAVDRGRGAPPDQHAGGAATAKMGVPGPEGSIGKLGVGRAQQGRLRAVPSTCSAPTACCRARLRDAPARRRRWSRDSLQQAFLRSRANSIEGGTSEVMRNILGERVLGLPGDVRVDRDVPWNQVPRS